jgi:hypothetical protein
LPEGGGVGSYTERSVQAGIVVGYVGTIFVDNLSRDQDADGGLFLR